MKDEFLQINLCLDYFCLVLRKLVLVLVYKCVILLVLEICFNLIWDIDLGVDILMI